MLPLPTSGQCYFTLAFSPDGRWLVAGGDRGAEAWDLHSPLQSPRRLRDLYGPIVRSQFATDGRLVVVAIGWLGSFEAGALEFLHARPIVTGRRAVVSTDGATVILSNGTLRRLAVNASDARLEWSREIAPDVVTDIAPTGNDRILVSRARPMDGGIIDVRDAAEGASIDTIPVTGRPHRIACSADGERAAILAHGNLSVWHLPTRALVADRNGPTHGGWLSLAFAPHGRRIVTGGIDSTVGVWDALADGPPLRTFQWGVGPVYAVAFDREGHRAAAAGHCGVLVWDVDE